LSRGTLRFYKQKLRVFLDYCQKQGLICITDITPNVIREYLYYISDTHNPGGCHALYRTLKAFLRWYRNEQDLPASPIDRIRSPKIPNNILDPVSIESVRLLLQVCDGERDKAILLILLDTGIRAGELLALNTEDINAISGQVSIKHGKGDKSRLVFMGAKTRRAVRAYIKTRKSDIPALFLSRYGERLSYDGLRGIITRLARIANITPPPLHSFRRAFAINFLRNGGDVFTLQMLLGHADLSVLRRYLKQTGNDLQSVHAKVSPVDSL